MALNCWLPSGTVAGEGVILMDVSVTPGVVTFTRKSCVTDPVVALMIEEPAARPVTMPCVVTVTAAMLLESQPVVLVMSAVLPSEKFPMAVS